MTPAEAQNAVKLALEIIARHRAGDVTTDQARQPWWQRYIEPWRDRGVKAYGLTTLDQYNPPSRIAYGHPGNREAVAVGSPGFPSTLLVFRNSTR